MADNADLVIKVAADTREAQRDIKRTKEEVKQLAQAGERAQQMANRAYRFGSMGLRFGRLGYRAYRIGGAAAQATGMVARGRIVAGGLYGAAGAGLLGGRAATAARWAGRIPGVGLLGGIAAGLATFRAIQNWSKRTAELAQEHSNIMLDLLREQRLTNRSIGTIQAGRMAASDPYGRGMRYWRAEMAYLAPTAAERQSLGMLASERMMNEQTRIAADRARGAQFAGLSTLRTRMNTGFQNMRLRTYRMLGDITSTPTGAAGLGLFGGLPGMIYGTGRMISQGFETALSPPGSPGPQTQAMLDSLRLQSRRQRNINLARLEARGPAAAAGPAPGFRAGTAEEYAFRVQQQSIARNREATIRWQDEVLRVLRQMAAEGVEGAEERLTARQIQFGRPVTTPSQVE